MDHRTPALRRHDRRTRSCGMCCSAALLFHGQMIARLLFLLMLANGTPLLANKILGDRLSHPLDSGARGPDGQPLFGASKTIRGILISVLVTAIAGRLVGLGSKIGALVGGA